jgi:prepilin-type N-terminal cleavage/methylation domain-containing protein
MRTHSLTSRHGFTLLEMLVAIAIFAVLLSSVGVLFTSILHLRQTSQEVSEQGIPEARAMHILENDLKHALPGGMDLIGAFTGTPDEKSKVRQDTLTFYSGSGVLTDADPWGDAIYVEYELDMPDDAKQHGKISKNTSLGLNLTRTVTRNLLALTSESLPTETLLHGVDYFQVDYYDKANTEWVDTWDTDDLSTKSLPSAVRVEIGFVDSGDPKERKRQPIQMVTELITETTLTSNTVTTSSSSSSSSSSK